MDFLSFAFVTPKTYLFKRFIFSPLFSVLSSVIHFPLFLVTKLTLINWSHKISLLRHALYDKFEAFYDALRMFQAITKCGFKTSPSLKNTIRFRPVRYSLSLIPHRKEIPPSDWIKRAEQMCPIYEAFMSERFLIGLF